MTPEFALVSIVGIVGLVAMVIVAIVFGRRFDWTLSDNATSITVRSEESRKK